MCNFKNMAKKNQHILPCSYLQWFSIYKNWRKSKVWVYDIRNNLFHETITIEHTAYIKRFYNIEWDNDIGNERIEDYMGNHIEGWINEIINKIDQKEIITDDEVETLGIFIGFQALRWPNQKQAYNKLLTWITKEELQKQFPDQRSIEKSAQEIEEAIWKKVDPNIIGNFISHTSNTLAIEDQNGYLKFLWDLFKDIAEKICSQKRFIYQSPEWELLTSDEPLSCIWSNGNNKLREIWLHNGIIIWFPLSSKSYVFFLWSHKHREEDSQSRICYFENNNLIEIINHASIINGTHWIIWKDQTTIEKFKNYNPKTIRYSNLKMIELVVEKFQSYVSNKQ